MSRRHDLSLDPSSTVVVEDLLQGLNEWRNIQDIIRLTFKALSDVVKSQGNEIKELERQVSQKVGRAEFNSVTQQKSNSMEVSQRFAEIEAALESRFPALEIQSLLEDKVSRSDMQYLLGNKASIDEVRTLLDQKVNSRDLEAEIHLINGKIEDFQSELSRKLTHFSSDKDIQHLINQLKEKPSWSDLEEALKTKANKDTVASALHKKCNRGDIEAILAQKAEAADIQGIFQALETKADYE